MPPIRARRRSSTGRCVTTLPSWSTNRPGRPRSSSHAGPASPRSSAALAATSAARHVAAATVTSRQRARAGRAGRRVDQMMLRSPAAQPASVSRRCSSRARRGRSMTVSPPGRPTTIGPVVARSPPADTQPPPSSASASSTVRPLTTPFRSRIERHAHAAGCRQRRITESTVGTAAGSTGTAPRGEHGEVAVVAGGEHGATDGGGDKPAGGASGIRARE